MLDVTEIFRSLQGESSYAGWPCVFVRLSGCNLRCRYCDTRYAYEPGTPRSVPDVLGQVDRLGPGLVEITGGEPLLQADTPELIRALTRHGRRVLLETNGSLPLPTTCRPYHAVMDLKCPSSGVSDRMYRPNLGLLVPGDDVKFVVADRADFEWAAARVREHRLDQRGLAVFVSPVFGELPPATLAQWVLESGLFLRLQLQLHRLLWPHTDRGV